MSENKNANDEKKNPDTWNCEHRKPATWVETFFDMAFAISKKSKDPSTQCGAVLVDHNNFILGTGFNGPPPQINDEIVPWQERPEKYAFILHADENALTAALGAHGKNALIGSKMFLTAMPCTECLLRMIALNVGRVFVPSCHKPYPLSKYQIKPEEIIRRQKGFHYGKYTRIDVLTYERK